VHVELAEVNGRIDRVKTRLGAGASGHFNDAEVTPEAAFSGEATGTKARTSA
jgi:hypothetical protein